MDDNSSSQTFPALVTEHGFSIHLQINSKQLNKNILFDVAQSPLLLKNAAELKISLKNLDHIILSHGHYDHTGCLEKILELNPDATLHLHPLALKKRYSLRDDLNIYYAGMSDKNIRASESFKNIDFVTTPSNIEKKIWITGEIPPIKPLSRVTTLFNDQPCMTPDKFEDDMSIFFDTPKGLAIITGCCHKGLYNTVEYIKKISGKSKIALILGGFHLKKYSCEQLDKTAEYISELNPDLIIPCHCTGLKSAEYISKRHSSTQINGFSGFNLELEL